MRTLILNKKRLPYWVYKLSDRQFAIYLNSIIDGDGTRPKGKVTCWVVYGLKALLDDLQIACAEHGYRATLTEYRKDTWRLNVTTRQYIRQDNLASEAVEEFYDGTVWCVTTHNDTVVVRRKGIVAITGNCRLRMYVAERAAALFELEECRLPHLLRLNDRQIDWIDDKRLIMLGKLPTLHGHEFKGSGGVLPARWLYLRTGSSSLAGHFHHPSSYTFRTLKGDEVGCWSVGCLCHLSPTFAKFNQWSHGYAIVTVSADGHYVVDNRRVLADGSVVNV